MSRGMGFYILHFASWERRLWLWEFIRSGFRNIGWEGVGLDAGYLKHYDVIEAHDCVVLDRSGIN